MSDRAEGTCQHSRDYSFVIREVAAVCYDWNSLTSVHELELLADRPIDAVKSPSRRGPSS